jgi:hypothetical protein
MQRFDAPSEDGRVGSQCLHWDHFRAEPFELCLGPAGGIQRYTEADKLLNNGFKAAFVVDGNQG